MKDYKLDKPLRFEDIKPKNGGKLINPSDELIEQLLAELDAEIDAEDEANADKDSDK